MKQQLFPVEPGEEAICASCWLDAGRQVKATMVLQVEEPALQWSSLNYLCGHHAELVELDEEER